MNLQKIITEHSFQKSLYLQIISCYEVHKFSLSTLQRIVKLLGFKYKKISPRINETKQIKRARIHFYHHFVKTALQPETELFFFDWTSFSEDNFRQNHGLSQAKKSYYEITICLLAASLDCYYRAIQHLCILSYQGNVEQ